MFAFIAQEIVSEWLWNLTFAYWHIGFSMLNMYLICKLFGSYSNLRAIRVSLLMHTCGLIVYAALVWFITTTYVVSFDISQPISLDMALQASLLLGVIYSIIQSTISLILHTIGIKDALYYIPAIWISNSIASLCSYGIIRLFTWNTF